MIRYAVLCILLSGTAVAETFYFPSLKYLGMIGNGIAKEEVWCETPCSYPQHLIHAGTLEVECASEIIVVTIPERTMGDYRYQKSPVRFRFSGEIHEATWDVMIKLESSYRNPDYLLNPESYKSVISDVVLLNGFDVGFVDYHYQPWRDKNLIGGGAYPNLSDPAHSSSHLVFARHHAPSSPARFPTYNGFSSVTFEHDSTERTPHLFSFSMSRKPLWDYLRERRDQSQAHDQAQAGVPMEAPIMEMLVTGISDPKSQERRNRWIGHPARYAMFGIPTWKSIELPDNSLIERYRIPDFAARELNRLENLFEKCNGRSPVLFDRSSPMGLAAREAQDSILRFRETNEWKQYKSLTLEEFSTLERED